MTTASPTPTNEFERAAVRQLVRALPTEAIDALLAAAESGTLPHPNGKISLDGARVGLKRLRRERGQR